MLSKHTAESVDIRSFLININAGVFQQAKLMKQRCLFTCSFVYPEPLQQAQQEGETESIQLKKRLLSTGAEAAGWRWQGRLSQARSCLQGRVTGR